MITPTKRNFISLLFLIGIPLATTFSFLKVSKPLHKSTYHEEKVSLHNSLKAKNVDIIFLGDSLTDNADWHEFFPNQAVINRGIKGDTIEGLKGRVTKLSYVNAKKIFLMIGINDLMRKHEISKLTPALNALITELSHAHQIIYLQSTLYIRSEDSAINQNITKLNQILENISLRYPNVFFIDLNKHLSLNKALKEQFTFDGIHLNGKGYQQWQKAISPYVHD